MAVGLPLPLPLALALENNPTWLFAVPVWVQK